MSFKITPLNASHNKETFDCGQPMLNHYIQKQAKQDVKRKLSSCFVLEDDTQNVKGYYTLSSNGISKNILPEAISAKLPRSYSSLPVTLLGRLAVDLSAKGQGLGQTLLIGALKRSYETALNSIGSMAVVVDPIDNNAVKFYEKYGFITLTDSDKMFLPIKTIASII